MKATINSYGQLVITAESELESYALKMWDKNYQPSGQGESVLAIVTAEMQEEDPSNDQ